MEDRFEQCENSKSSENSGRDVSCQNQETPDDLKDKNAQHTEARKVGATPSSINLPKINMADFDKWEMVVNQCGPVLPEVNQCLPSDSQLPANKDTVDGSEPVKDSQNRVVREKSPGGKDVVVAYDDKGEPHKFVNEPIEKMPPDFSKVPDWRQQQLDKEAKETLDRYSGAGSGGGDPTMDFKRVSDMQKEIARRQDLTETEKCLLYSKIQVNMREGGMKVENWNEKREMVDSWTGERDPWHAIAPIDDKYHNRLVNMSPEEASKTIFEQEDEKEGDMHDSKIDRALWKTARFVLGRNEGDINASEAQLKCMRELREKGTFAAYADEWEKQYVNPKAPNPHLNDPWGGAEGAPSVSPYTGGAGGNHG